MSSAHGAGKAYAIGLMMGLMSRGLFINSLGVAVSYFEGRAEFLRKDFKMLLSVTSAE